MRQTLTALALLAASAIVTADQAGDAKVQAWLKRIFPAATSFSAKEGDPAHFKAFVNQQLAGYVFWTTELEPLERGYDGPIKMLVGLDTKGIIAGLIVVEHHEPYGNFSVEPPRFAEMFKGKSIRDPFKVGQDVDAVSRATITMTSATRAIKNATRRIARQYLTAPSEGSGR